MLDSKHTKIMAELGFIAASKGKNDAANAIAKGLIQIRSDYAIGHVIQAICYMNNRQWAAASTSIESGLKAEPNNETALMMMALVHKNMGNQRMAYECIDSLKQIGDSPELNLSQQIVE